MRSSCVKLFSTNIVFLSVLFCFSDSAAAAESEREVFRQMPFVGYFVFLAKRGSLPNICSVYSYNFRLEQEHCQAFFKKISG